MGFSEAGLSHDEAGWGRQPVAVARFVLDGGGMAVGPWSRPVLNQRTQVAVSRSTSRARPGNLDLERHAMGPSRPTDGALADAPGTNRDRLRASAQPEPWCPAARHTGAVVGTLESDAGDVGLTPTQVAAVAHVQALAERDRGAATERAAEVLARAAIDLGVDELCGRIAEVGRVALNFHPDRIAVGGRVVVEALLEDGVYRNQFETGISNGGLGAIRERFEDRLFAGSYRRTGLLASERPKYGVPIEGAGNRSPRTASSASAVCQRDQRRSRGLCRRHLKAPAFWGRPCVRGPFTLDWPSARD